MSSVLPYRPANSPDSKKDWGWRDGLCLSIGVALLLPLLPGPSMMAKEAFANGELWWSFLWSVSVMFILALGLALSLIGITHEAKDGIRKFFRDQPNRLGFGSLVGIMASVGLTIEMIFLALLKFEEGHTFVAMNYLTGAVFFVGLALSCVFVLINWALSLIGDSQKEYLQAAATGDPHDF